ncbi:Fe(3+) ions import ATP-binding protein FbpC [bacterium HR27]|nr:Fe(3+) ions import ATP-binding protein FbpC [bacterium HR27]
MQECVVVQVNGVWKRYPGSGLPAVRDLSLAVRAGELVSIVGPSGCGKTTTLRLIAGLERPDRGTIVIDGRCVADDRRFVPPEQRGVGLVFQDYALFPHLTVEENITFGIRKWNRAARAERVQELLELTSLAPLRTKYPHQLSGGQQQRVAIARALAPRPIVLLLDEPFANLDAELRQRMRDELRQLLREVGVTVILVTHDREEALVLADRVAVMLDGTIVQVDTPERIYLEPRTRDVARLVGEANFVPVRLDGTLGQSDLGAFAIDSALPTDGCIELLVRPRDVVLEPHPEGLAVVVDRRFTGAEILYRVVLACGITVETSQPPSVELPVGTRVAVRCNRARLAAFAGNERIGLAALLEEHQRARTSIEVLEQANGRHRESVSSASVAADR